MIFGRKIPRPRQAMELPPDRAALALKAARRQAYRYGQQIRQHAVGSLEHLALGIAWATFLSQFGDGTEGTQVTIDYLCLEYERGVTEAELPQEVLV